MIEFDTITLVLSGGNALGAYQAGAVEALQAHGIEPDWVAGASAGSLNGAIICGNAPEARLDQLEKFWRPGSSKVPDRTPFWPGGAEIARRTAAVTTFMTLGRDTVFTPRRLFGPFWEPFANGELSSLYDTTPLAATLERLLDFNRLNVGTPRFCATAVNLEDGQDVVFDTEQETITAAHLRASSALLPAFPPVEVNGRLFGDAGISANLPIDVVLSQPPAGRTLCIALDLLPLAGARPATLGDSICRMQDLMFATQSRRAIAAWQAIYDERVARADAQLPSITLLHIAYADQGAEVSGKAFDFSPTSVRARWRAGQRDLDAALGELARGGIETERPGLTVYRPERGDRDGPRTLRIVRESMTPAII